MSDKDPNSLTHYNNKGQEDYQKGEYNPPNDTPLHFFHMHDYEIDQVKAYDAGYHNAKEQDK